MISLELNLPSRDGFDLKDEEDLDEVFSLYDYALNDLTEQIREQANNPNYIVVGGKTLQEKQRKGDFFPGMVVQFHGTWSEALSLARKGWRICDGTFGTPQFHPHPNNGGSQRVPRGAVWGKNSGSTGGADTHAHAATAGGHTHDLNGVGATTNDPGTHTHTIAPNNDAADPEYMGCVGSTYYAACVGHDHGGATGPDGDHVHTLTGATASGDADPTIVAGSSVQPVVDVIFLMYRGTI